MVFTSPGTSVGVPTVMHEAVPRASPQSVKRRVRMAEYAPSGRMIWTGYQIFGDLDPEHGEM
jgi:hypothetical protein